jgi:glycosyltransferase involved in cell wall biosynthesis
MVTQDAPSDPGPGIRVLGRLDDAALADAYREAWLFCLPSDYEGFGIPYAEALACGTPVVATPNLGARYVLDDGRTGVLVDLTELGATLAELLTDPDRLAELRDAGAARSRQFTLTRVVDQYEDLYRRTPTAAGTAVLGEDQER